MISISNQYLQVKINPHGACLAGITDVGSGNELLFAGNPDYWNFSDHVLFPFIGRLNGGEYSVNGQIFRSDIHGFTKDSDFEIVNHNQGEVTLKSDYSAETLAIYPYKFGLKVTYKLNGNMLTVTAEVNNYDQKELSFEIGMHPAFALDCDEDNYLILKSDRYDGYKLKNNLLTPLADMGCFGSIKLDKALFQKYGTLILRRKTPETIIKRKHFAITVKSDSPVIAIWADENRDSYVCVESWWGLPDYADNPIKEISEKTYVNKLAAGRTGKFGYSIKISRSEDLI